MAASKFVSSGILFFLDQLVLSAGNWFYWIIVSGISMPSEIGQTTAVYNLVGLVAILTQLGLEYPILKKSSTRDSKIFGSALLILLMTTLPGIPILVYSLNNFYDDGSFQQFTLLAITLLILIALSFVSHWIILGASDIKNVLIIDSIGNAIKFMVGYVLAINGYGAFGLLLSFLLQALFVAVICLILSIRMFGFSIGKMKYIKEIGKEAVFNMPSKLSWVLLPYLSTVLLALFGISSSEIGIFYMALNISFFVGGFILSMAQMAIPHSAISKRDLSSMSSRIGLSFTAPLIGALIVSPGTILFLLGAQYLSAETTLKVLAISIFPFAIVINGISKFNYSEQPRKVLLIGSIQILAFVTSFLFLISQHGILGVAFSVLIAYTASSVPVIIWSERALLVYIANSAVAILIGSISGLLLIFGGANHIVAILSSIIIILIVNLALKNTSFAEIKQLLNIIVRRT